MTKRLTRPHKKTGRPTLYSDEMVTRICSEMITGRSLRSICKDKGMPAATRVFEWLHIHPEFREKYARAQEERTEAMAEDLMAIADQSSVDPQLLRLRVDTRKWLMSKMKPKKYGEHIRQEVTGILTLENLLTQSRLPPTDPPSGG